MIISQSYYFKHLIAESKNSAEAKQCLEQYIATSNIDNSYIINAYKSGKLDIKVIDFYKFMINKLHKIITELLDDSSKTACQLIKTVTSLITQSTITLDKQFDGDVELANEFMNCVGLKDLSQSLATYFTNGDLTDIKNQLNRVKADVLFVKNNFC